MACSTIRSVMVDKASVTPIATISRLVSKQTSSSSTTPAAIPRLVIPSSTTSTSESLLSLSSLFTATTPQPDDLRAPAPVLNSTAVSGITSTSTTRPILASASTATTTKASGSSVPIAPRPRFIPRNRRSLTSSGGDSSNWAILFPGQGSQFVGMGKDLYDTYPVARQVVDEADDALGGTLKNVMFEGSQEDLTRTENAQPAILTTSIAMLRVLESERGFKIEESCKHALGHSLGEYSALVATKAVTLHDAVKLVRLRGQAMTKAVTNKGTTAMSALVVRADKLESLVKAMDEIKASLPAGELAEIANINSSFQVVISGTVRGVDHASRMLQAKKIAARAVDLPVSAPFHCSLMQPAADEMKIALKDVHFQKPVINVISNVTAKPITKVEDISDLLVQQVTGTVQWHSSIKYLRDQENVHDFISLGPGKVLANLLRKEYPLDFVKTVTTAEDIQQWAL
ncbi:hypothetical protein BGZ95_012147 [Linnemannia exigua]|uniref:[acyl-carrier-protein] S-malonyltransferase n=1 Tax=Linnemannia exigua TaxID=604196 RepID=A0AAD4D8W0_9FUNG|nr:hypothetical protein BGZ95_012147 [Linnemannia exigua]